MNSNSKPTDWTAVNQTYQKNVRQYWTGNRQQVMELQLASLHHLVF
jgi:hypothetical protein